jgi:hypothetical protein
VANESLGQARAARFDEFYTQYQDIEKEINSYLDFNADVFKGKTVLLPCDDPEWSNFTKFFAQKFQDLGLKKLISTSYAPTSKSDEIPYQPTLFEKESPRFDGAKTREKGKIFSLTKDSTGDGVVNVEDLEWSYLEGDGDFRSTEISALLDEADVVITNPPFSLFRPFLKWILEGKKKFVIIGSTNAIAYPEVFESIKNNQLWLGNGFTAGNAYFATPVRKEYASGVYDEETGLVKFRNVSWFTNLEHGRRHVPIALMTEADNVKFSRHKNIRAIGYKKYDSYDAIDVPFVDSIPSDYGGLMGVPITFLDKYSPEQFEIVGLDRYVSDNPRPGHRFKVEGRETYARVLIRHRGELA